MQRKQSIFAFVTLWILIFACVTTLSAQVNTATLSGTVTDPQGLAVKGATVTVTSAATGAQRTANVGDDGRYSLVGLPPGEYKLRAGGGASFAVVENPSLVLTVGEDATLNLQLQLRTQSQIVTVTGEAALIETSKTEVSQTVEQLRIDNLPINGRNYLNFTLTNSQVTRDNAPPTGAAPTSGFNSNGQRARANLVNVDGADATDNAVNGVRSTVSQEAVQEFQIITNNYAAEYGRASGGVVNIITRSGSNEFHGDVFGYLRNRNFQAVNPFSTERNPAYTRVQAGTAFGGPIKKDKTFYFFSYEITRRHETGFSSIGQNNFGLVPFDTTQVGQPFGTLQLTPGQIAFLTDPATLAAEANPAFPGFAQEVGKYTALAGASSGMAVNGVWPQGLGGISGFPTTCQPPGPCFVPASYQTLASQTGNFPVFEGTSLYSLRLDHNLNSRNRLTLRVNVSPSTVTGIEVSGQNQPAGQNSRTRASQQTYRDVTGILGYDTFLGSNVNQFLFQYARRGLAYFYSSSPGGSDPAVNIPGFAFFGREPYSFIQRVEQRYQFTDSFSWKIGRHATKFGVDFNYLPTNATFTVNYGGVYDFGAFGAANLGFMSPPTVKPFPDLSPVQAYGAGLPGDFIQGIGSPKDSFSNKALGLFWEDSWRINPHLTLNYGVRYDVEFPPKFAPPTGLALTGYNFLGLQKGIQADTNNVQPRVGLAWDPKGDGETVVRASYGIFFDHPLLGLYFLGDASDGSKSGQLAFPGTGACSGAGNPGNLNAIPIFQGLLINPAAPQCAPSPSGPLNASLGYLPNQQQFQALNFPQSLFLNQNYITAGFPLGFQPFGYPQGKNFVYAYSEQANLSVERDLGNGFSLNVAYNFNGGHHLNRPINANTIRGDFMMKNLQAAVAAGKNKITDSPFLVSSCGVGPNGPFVNAALVNFFRPSGINPSVGEFLNAIGGGACIPLANSILAAEGLNAKCDPSVGLANCVPFGDMDANYSNGSSVYHGLSTNLRKRINRHYELLASYTWSHAIDDSTDLQATLTPQDSYFPAHDRSTSTFDQRHRFVFSGVYQSGKLSGDSFGSKLLSNWTIAPLIEFASGRPFNIITGNGDNLQLSSLTGRPNTFANPNCGATVNSKSSPTGIFQAPCLAGFDGTLLSLDGNLGRNAGITPWVAFSDLRVAKRLYFGERFNVELITDIFNIPNRFNVAAVNVLFTNAGQPTAAYDPRQFQFAMKLHW